MADPVLFGDAELSHRLSETGKGEERVVSKSFFPDFLKGKSTPASPFNDRLLSGGRDDGDRAFKSCSPFRKGNRLHQAKEFFIV